MFQLTLFIVQFGMFAFGPLLRLGVQRVLHGIVGIVFEANASRWIPFGVLFPESLLGVCSDLQLLALPQFDYQYLVVTFAVLIIVLIPVPGRSGQHLRIAWLQIGRSYVASLLIVALHVQLKLHTALRTELEAATVPRILHPVNDLIRNKRNQSDTMSKEFIGQHRWIGLQLHPVNGQCRCLRDKNAPQTICNTVCKQQETVFCWWC